MNPVYLVRLTNSAECDLAEILLHDSDWEEITRLENIANRQLSRTPEVIGQYVSEGLYSLTTGKLRFYYLLDREKCVVEVDRIQLVSQSEERI